MSTDVRTRNATRPLPRDLWKPFFMRMRDLAMSGRFVYRGNEWGVNRGNLMCRRTGCVVLLSSAIAARFSEVARLRVQDLHDRSVIVTRSKDSESGQRPVPPWLVRIVRRWRYEWETVYSSNGLLFPSNRLTPLDNDRMNEVLQSIGAVFGVPLTTHVLRDTAAQMSFERATVNQPHRAVSIVKRLMGHKTLAITERYLAKQQDQQFECPLTEVMDG